MSRDLEEPARPVPAGVWCEAGSARAVIGAAIGAAVEQLDAELPRAREGTDPEGVHQARVATRRLRSDLRTFAPLLDDDWRVRTRAELAWLADALGAVRDTDVLGIRLHAAFDAIEIDDRAAGSLLDVLQQQGTVARQTLVEVIDDDRTGALIAELHRRAMDPPTTLSAVGHAELRMRPLVRRPWRKLSRAVASLDDEPAVAELHRVRLLAKRTRYAAEAVVGVFGRDARRFVTAVRGIQDVLGDMNDAEVAIAWLREVSIDLDPTAAFAAGEAAHHFREVADAHRHGWERSFRRATKRSTWLS